MLQHCAEIITHIDPYDPTVKVIQACFFLLFLFWKVFSIGLLDLITSAIRKNESTEM